VGKNVEKNVPLPVTVLEVVLQVIVPVPSILLSPNVMGKSATKLLSDRLILIEVGVAR